MAEPESEMQEAVAQESVATASLAPIRPVVDGPTAPAPPSPLPQQPCPTCGSNGAAMPASYVYALGRIDPRFPRLSIEKEFAQATGRAETVNLTDRQALRQVLEHNRYLVKQLCWVMTVGGLETYIVVPRDPGARICSSRRCVRTPSRAMSISSSACGAPWPRPRCATVCWCRSSRSISSIRSTALR